MAMLSDDDLDLQDMSEEDLARAWDLWFDLAQETNDADPPYTHGVFVLCEEVSAGDSDGDAGALSPGPAPGPFVIPHRR